jgi:hypothetical protein
MKQLTNGILDQLNTIAFGGDETTFLFNLTHNLRFEALKSKEGHD